MRQLIKGFVSERGSEQVGAGGGSLFPKLKTVSSSSCALQHQENVQSVILRSCLRKSKLVVRANASFVFVSPNISHVLSCLAISPLRCFLIPHLNSFRGYTCSLWPLQLSSTRKMDLPWCHQTKSPWFSRLSVRSGRLWCPFPATATRWYACRHQNTPLNLSGSGDHIGPFVLCVKHLSANGFYGQGRHCSSTERYPIRKLRFSGNDQVLAVSIRKSFNNRRLPAEIPSQSCRGTAVNIFH